MATNFWNNLDLPTPVIVSRPLNCDNSYRIVAELKSVMVHIKKMMNQLNQLHMEAAALSRLIYRTKYKLRQEKSFQALRMINRCLNNYLTMHLQFTLNSIGDTLKGGSGPSRQMLEWALVRIYGVVHLFHRVYSLCISAAGHLCVRMKLAHFFDITTFAIGIVSRIWTYAQFIVRQGCQWYKSLHQFLDVLHRSPTPWLPKDVILPSDLIVTLNNCDYLQLNAMRKPDELFSQIKIPPSKNDKTKLNKNLGALFDFDDVGESVSRQSLKECSLINVDNETPVPQHKRHNINTSNQCKDSKVKKPYKHPTQILHNVKSPLNKKKNWKSLNIEDQPEKKQVNNEAVKYEHGIKTIKSSRDLEKFLEIETALRNQSTENKLNYQPLMKDFDKLQWAIIEKSLRKKLKLIKKSEKTGNISLQENLLKGVQKFIKMSIS